MVSSAWKAVFPSAFLASAWHLAVRLKRSQGPSEPSGAGLRRQRIGCLRIGFGFACAAWSNRTGGHWISDLRQWKSPAFCSHLTGEHVSWKPLTLSVSRPRPSGGSHSLEQRSAPCGGQLETSTGETIAGDETISMSPTCKWWVHFWGGGVGKNGSRV